MSRDLKKDDQFVFKPFSSLAGLALPFPIDEKEAEAVSKVIDPVILNLFQDPNESDIRSRNKFGMTRSASILTFDTASSNPPPGVLTACPLAPNKINAKLTGQTTARQCLEPPKDEVNEFRVS